ncbi:MAG: histidine phosphatase family protein [Spirochaetaceae bacterium]|nr:histidine phosphatase family protein [Spirochaetaceae bacterium]
MKLYVVRHGDKVKERDWNDSLGILDNGLSELGYRQGLTLASYLLDKDIASVYASRYARTRQTIAEFAARTGIPIQTRAWLDEIDMGDYLREEAPTVRDSMEEEWTRNQREYRDYRYSGGETGYEVFLRIDRMVEELKGEAANAVLVSHEGWIKLFLCRILDLDPGMRFHFRVDTCGIMEAEYGEDGWLVSAFNLRLGAGGTALPAVQ